MHLIFFLLYALKKLIYCNGEKISYKIGIASKSTTEQKKEKIIAKKPMDLLQEKLTLL